MTSRYTHDVKDLSLAEEGVRRISGRRARCRSSTIRRRFAKDKPLQGLRLSACLHVTTETANLMLALKDGGAQIALCASNPLSTQDDVAAALVAEYGIPTFAKKGEDDETYYRHIHQALEHMPQMSMDDGADLVATIHRERRDLIPNVIGGTEETTTGVIAFQSMARDGAWPIRSSPSTRRTPSTSSTIATAPARAPSTA
jgi:adenosylhomocysteinase